LLKDSIWHKPFHIFSDAARILWQYSEWLSADVA
jgi:hypothetical protein